VAADSAQASSMISSARPPEANDSAWARLVAEFGPTIATVTRMYRMGSADAADVAQMT
jgi:hypothetical protein